MRLTMPQNLFAYGTLLDPVIQLKIVGRVLEGVPAVLNEYKKRMHTFECGEYPIIEVSALDSVKGVVLALTEKELNFCDLYEGTDYKRVVVTLQKGTTSWVYVVNEN